MTKKIILCGCFLLLCFSASGQGLIVTDKPVIGLPPHRIIPRPPRPIDPYIPVQVQSSDIDVKINGQIATTTITQTLYNPARRRVQGHFLFPLPKDARIDSFSMEIDDELTEGELLDAEKARKIYEDIVRRTLDPALFEYSDHGLFKVRIFPFEACSTKEIRIRYSQLLPKDGNLISYTLPFQARELCPALEKKAKEKFSFEIKLAAQKEQMFRTVYSPSHDIDIDYRKKKTKATVVLTDRKDIPVTDFQLVFSTQPADADAEPLTTEFFTSYDPEKEDEGHFLLLISPQVWQGDEQKILPKDVVFVLDSSASMRDGKLDKAKEGLDFCLDSLNPEDRFQIVRFSTDSETLFDGLVPASEKNVEKAEKFIESIKPIGGTAVEEALSVAIDNFTEEKAEGRPRQLIFITDGKPTLGATNEKVLVRGVKRQLEDAEIEARVFSFGIGDKINTHLLDLLARETKAYAQYALPDEDIELKISRFYSRFAEPVYADLSIDIDGPEWIRAVTPKTMPDIFRGDQLVVLGRFKKGEGEGELTLSGTFRGKEESYTFPLSFEKSDGKQNRFIPRLWAVRQVGWLLEQIRLNGESGELKDEVTRLAREYAIVTPYTSWLIIEDEARRNVPFTNRSFRDIDSSPVVRMRVESKASSFARSTSGTDALASAASEADLKSARNIAAQTTAMKKSNYTGTATAKEEVTVPQSRIVNGKSFYCNSGQWVDSLSQSLGSDVPVKQIKFGSDDYFKFLHENPAACQWFSVGKSMRLALNEKEIIEIIN